MTNRNKLRHGGKQPMQLGNTEITEILHRRAQETSKSLRWNRNVLLLTCAVLAATTLVTLNVGGSLLAAIVAVPGLGVIWAFTTVLGRRLERQIFEDDAQAYSDLISQREQDEQISPGTSVDSPLSERELEVLKQIAGGSSNKQAALTLSISDQTVKNHLSHIFEKLHVSDRTSAVMVALSSGWIEGGSTCQESGHQPGVIDTQDELRS